MLKAPEKFPEESPFQVVGEASEVRCLWLRQLMAIMWKNVFVTRIRRHYVATFLEVALMTALLLNIQEDAVVREPLRKHEDTVFHPMSPTAYWNTSATIDIRTVLITPDNNYTSWLTRTALAKLGVKNVSVRPTVASVHKELARRNKTPTDTLGLVYSELSPNDSDPTTLHVSFLSGNLPMDVKLSYNDRLVSEPEGPVDERRFPEMTTLLPIMAVLQQTHLDNHARSSPASEPLPMPVIRRFPYPSYFEYHDQKNYVLVLSRFCIGMLVPFALYVALITEESSSGKKEMLRLAGVNDWVYWASHYLSGFCMHVIISALMVIILCVRRNEQGRAFVQYSDPTLVFFILMCFCSSCIIHPTLLSFLFEAPHSAVAFAMMYWTLTCVMPFLAIEHPTGLGYEFITRGEKLATSVLPGMSLHWSLRVLEKFEKFVEHGANWGNFYDSDATPDNVTVAEIVFVGFTFDLLIALVVWYLDNTVPYGPGVHRSLLYPLKSGYWMPAMSTVTAPETTSEDKPNFESDSRGLPIAIEFYHACKDYDDVPAVRDVSFRIYEGEVMALLGHNGAGKTSLLNMITAVTQ
ncbi:phospholipid-transporting ATPase ABCA3-like [Haemaphysalis longicornis]